MKRIFLTGLSAFALIAFGCSDKTGTTDIDAGNDGTKVEGYLSLQINGSATRTTGIPTEDGEGDENLISSATILLVDGSGNIAVVEEPSITGGVTEPFKVAVGTYFVYALINKPVNVAVTTGVPVDQVIDVAAGEYLNGYNNGSFFMVNARNSEGEEAGVEVIVTENNTFTSPAQAQINVDRIAVRIEPNPEAQPTDVSAITSQYAGFIDAVSIDGFALLNVNKQFNMLQTWGTDNGSGDVLTADVLQTPFYSTTIVADQYHQNISEYADIEWDTTNPTVMSTLTDLTAGQTGIFNLETVYAIENRPTMMFFDTDHPTAGRGETTGVIYKATATNGGAANTFFVYNGTMYSDVTAIQALPDFANVTLPVADYPALRGYGIKVYENGVMYYTYFILDPNSEYLYNGENYFGVFRNSIYRLAVNSLSALGDDVPGGGKVDPEQPGDPGNPPINSDDAYIQVTVTINPWVLNTINIDF